MREVELNAYDEYHKIWVECTHTYPRGKKCHYQSYVELRELLAHFGPHDIVYIKQVEKSVVCPSCKYLSLKITVEYVPDQKRDFIGGIL